MRLADREDMRELDRATIEDHGTPGRVLMERAGRGVAGVAARLLGDRSDARVLIVCGRGNNGGDGYVAARELRLRGADVNVFSCESPAALGGDARLQHDRLVATGATVRSLARPESWSSFRREARTADLIIDAILGTGFHGNVTGDLVDVIEILNDAPAVALAVDLPSGLDADTGAVSDTCVIADVTATLGCPKVGLYVDPGRAHAGEVEVIDIGLAAAALDAREPRYELLGSEEAALLLPMRHPNDHKGVFGRVLVVGGATGMSGAVVLAGRAALRTGAGLATIAAPRSLLDSLEAQTAEVMTVPLPETGRGCLSVLAVDRVLEAAQRADAVAIGPGMTRDLEAVELIRHLLGVIDTPIVLDADGLNAFEGRADELGRARAPLILTPHAGEMARLVGSDPRAVESERLVLPGRLAEETGAIVLLKGSPSVVACRGRPAWLSGAGNPGMATAGAGDVLTGVILAFLGQGLIAPDAAGLGMIVHALAGDAAAARLGVHGLIAGDLIEALPGVLDSLARRGEQVVFE